MDTFQLDRTYMNDERFAGIHQLIGRKFSQNVIDHCKPKQQLVSGR